MRVHEIPCYIITQMWSWSGVGGRGCGEGVTWPITHHTEESFVGAGATLSAPLFWLSLHAPVPQQMHVCEGCECNIQVNLWKPVSLTKCFSLSFYFFIFLASLCWPVTHHLQPCSLSCPFIWQCQTWLSMDIIVLLLSSIEFSVVIFNGRNSCLRGYRHVHRKKIIQPEGC